MAQMIVRATRVIEVDQNVMNGWADLSGDRNPLHVDPTYAAGTPFGATIAHGHYTLALMEELMLGVAGARWRRGGTLRKVRFRSPVRPGHRYTLTATSSDSAPEAWRLEVRVDSEETLAAEAEAVLLEEPPWSA